MGEPGLDAGVIEREGRNLARHLLGTPAPKIVLDHYLRAHELGRLRRWEQASPFDRFQLLIVRRLPFLVRPSEAYAALFRRRGALRLRTTLLCALLETTGETHRRLLEGRDRKPISALGAILGHGLLGGLAAIVGVLLFALPHGLSLLIPRRSGAET